MINPDKVLWNTKKCYRRPVIPSCDHYAGNESFIKKATEKQQKLGPIFDITLDCDDGSVVDQERQQVELFIKIINDSSANKFSRIGVRVHSPDSNFFEHEVESLIKHSGSKLSYITIPKVGTHSEFAKALSWIDELVTKHLDDRKIPIHPIVETLESVEDVFSIAAEPSVECISFGIMDFVSSFDTLIPDSTMKSPDQFTHPSVVSAKKSIVAACAAHQRVASHNVTIKINDEDIVLQDANRARYFGFTRMWSIHPSQIEPIIRAMTPCRELISYASDILIMAYNNHWGPVKDANDELKDRASYRYYWQILKLAQSMNIDMPDGVKVFFDS
ncbi:MULTISPECIES: HpcH/HpaI aldolase/citrate lyase family protein [Candidatus Ichthyocystis]|uniref:Citrate lyase beta subunit n=1 Tax=Candidatus Ichthyocystis hellenicum TaxID=1561003 RepID=A0A0S4M2T8_9BURK|nr:MULTISPECIES: aldolase/citrate lyase family protein [Ichthyocystis]CUT18087.1 Citrate lyase beta subunit [Candidatus Ichthyocystis hellenicum]